METTEIELRAIAFRGALERVPRNRFCKTTSLGCSPFPNGCCDDASLLLGAYLTDSGVEDVRRVSGSRIIGPGNEVSHAWLQANGLIVDITGDQSLFGEHANGPVVVCTSSPFHDEFDIEVGASGSGDFRRYFKLDKRSLVEFQANYSEVLSYLE